MALLRRKKKTKKSEAPNKKVRNATRVVVDGILFRSKLEAYCYEKLKEAGIEAGYETVKYTLMHPFRFNGEAVRAITYTPDFVGEKFIIECKGFANETFPIKWKLFKFYLYMNKIEVDLYKVQNQKQVNEMIEDILKKQNEGKEVLQ